jgi:farnesyl-diphosphate farnesyltransferase
MEAQNQTHMRDICLQDSLSYCENIIPKVSRSFVIGINMLKGQTKKSILVGYLLCRIIDTIEDDFHLNPDLKESYLKKFPQCFENKDQTQFYCEIGAHLTGDSHHLDLVKNTDKIFQVYFSLSPNTQSVIKHWVSEMAYGMATFVRKYPHGIRLTNVVEYKKYCYYVAGTVGYMLTELWHEYAYGINSKIFKILYQNSDKFGEALQSVNILKDIYWDAQKENSIYIPLSVLNKQGVSHKTMFYKEFLAGSDKAAREILTLAQENLMASLEYIKHIPKRNFRVRFFCIFPLLLAFATLRKLNTSNNIITPDSIIKVSRKEVKKIIRYSFFSLFSNCYLMKLVKNY